MLSTQYKLDEMCSVHNTNWMKYAQYTTNWMKYAQYTIQTG